MTSAQEGTDPAPTVSILASVFNEERHLTQMLESIGRQTYPSWELLIVDDASTDRTPEIIDEFASADSRIRVISTGIKLGKVGAFNSAFEASTGDLVVLMAGDDVMPKDSLLGRVQTFSPAQLQGKTVGYFKLRTTSTDRKFDGMLLPRGDAGSRSGPSMAMTRPLARLCFPVPETLPSEDSWLGEVTEALADEVIDSGHVAVRYRIHTGNSNPRHKSFHEMSEAMHRRARAWGKLLADDTRPLPEPSRERLRLLTRVEELRYNRKVVAILRTTEMPLVDRLANASMASPVLFRVRSRFYRWFSGWRGR